MHACVCVVTQCSDQCTNKAEREREIVVAKDRAQQHYTVCVCAISERNYEISHTKHTHTHRHAYKLTPNV